MLPTIAPPSPRASASQRRAGSPAPPRAYYRPSPGPRDLRTVWGRSCRGRAWRPRDAPRLPATVPVWSGADRWIEALTAALREPAGEQLRRGAQVRADTVLDVAAADARAADRRTGRGVATAHATVAAALGCSSKTVQRARLLIEALGFARTVVAGRYLTSQERADARQAHGGDQRRIASERALLVPPNVHLPRRGELLDHSPGFLPVPRRPPAAARAASRPSTRTEGRSRAYPRTSMPVQRLAGRLAQRLPWLAHGHIGGLCHTLSTLGLDDTGWTAQDVLDLLDHRNTAQGLYSVPSSSQRDPLALLAHQLRAALVDVDEPPRRRRERLQAALRAEQARDRAARAERQALVDAERADPEAQARIAAAKQQILDQLRTKTTRHLPPSP